MTISESTQNTCKGFLSLQNGLSVWFTRLHNHGQDNHWHPSQGEGKTQTFIAKEAGCSQSAVSKHVNRKLSGRKKCGRKRYTTNRENRSLMRIVKQNQFKNLGELHKERTENESHIHIKTLVWMSDRIILSFHLLRVIPDDSAAQYSCLLHTSWFWKKKNVLVRNCTLVFFSLKFPLVMRNMTSGVIHDTNGEAVGGALLSL